MTMGDDKDITVRRVYDAVKEGAPRGRVYLVDAMWPRGVRKADLRVDDWLKGVAPSRELRTWFGHDPERWPEFRRRYRAELDEHAPDLRPLEQAAAEGPVTLLYAAHDERRNNAVVLADYLRERVSER
ncbi:DUF488 domain-containing protein [Marinitenerispora sediminis]|uniref:DUF488 domain-containing protein n=1 Tax=Marinitenerispora sediminis TaxID=1931232 RepID=A0A368T4G2_9ACTN|nr:DUF488 family protein [Marinitenerispora sediminis]RCV50159.1 DUF488 domain-containing protein [Marinitenerispora sediminis]RCV50315.1 DUF488 domain-containing protein [Marinitenerispora sediminis]RCV57712.1 DUF488 domain-containing protein [Marinitenerispora sediminis]